MKVGKRARLNSPRYVHVIEHSVLRVWEIYALENAVFYIGCTTIYFLYTQHRMLKCTCIIIVINVLKPIVCQVANELHYCHETSFQYLSAPFK